MLHLFHWLDWQRRTLLFKTLWQRLCEAPILTLTKGMDDFVVYCHTSILGLGAVLMQRGYMIACTLRYLKPHEANYPTHDFELGLCFFPQYLKALLVWGQVHYLYWSQEPEYMMDQLNLNMRQQRWLDVVKDYDCEILYHPCDNREVYITDHH